MRAAFVCRTCGVELSDWLVETDETRVALGESIVARGRFVRAARGWAYRELLPGTYASTDGDAPAVHAGDYLLHPDDVRHEMRPDARFGCCSWHPRGAEPNATCARGHDIGTWHADPCWSSLVFRLIGERVERVEVS